MKNLRIDKSSTHAGILSALAVHENPDDFCRQVLLLGLEFKHVHGVFILAFSAEMKLDIVGSCRGSILELDLSILQDEVRFSLNSQNRELVRTINISHEELPDLCATIIPSFRTDLCEGVLLLLHDDIPQPGQIEEATFLSLSFASGFYCSESRTRSARNRLNRNQKSSTGRTLNELTERQLLILSFIQLGKTNDIIARLLNFSMATVKNDLAWIFHVLGVSSRIDAVIEAEKRGLLPPPPRGGQFSEPLETGNRGV